ncbi:MAG: hypothetical protein AAF483_15395 [Planctomycetota bacterium]
MSKEQSKALDLLRLRPEAGCIGWKTLNESQRDAFRRVLYMLEEAIEHIPDGEDLLSHEYPSLVQPYRSSRVAFINGTRGSGKSSVMLSLIEATIKETGQIPYVSKRPEKFEKALRTAHKHVIWLEPIDLDPLPSPFSLIPSILDRVKQALTRLKSSRGKGSSIELNEYESTIAFQNLYVHAALAWDSNIEARKAELDPESYAIEMQSTNESRLSFNQQFDNLLVELTKTQFSRLGFEKPLFVVPIDDFDLHPRASQQILRMLRMLATPRVFYLLLGDVQILELMSDLNISSEFGREVPVNIPMDTLGIQPQQIAKLAGAVSRNALRKLLPSEQRVRLDNPHICEGLIHEPNHQHIDKAKPNAPRLFELCKNIPFRVDGSLVEGPWTVTGSNVITLFDYFFHPGINVFESVEQQELDQADLKALRPLHNGENEDTVDVKVIRDLFLPDLGTTTVGFLKDDEYFKRNSNERGANDSLAKVRAFDKQIKSDYTWANHLFSTSPRRLTDIWFALRRRASFFNREFEHCVEGETVSVKKLNDLLETIENEFVGDLSAICRELLLEETAFTPAERERISASLTPNSLGDFNWSQLPVRLVSVTATPNVINGDSWASNRKRVLIDNKRIRNLYHEIRVRRVDDWAVVAEALEDKPKALSASVEGVDASRELTRSTSASMMLLHDWLKLCPSQVRFESNLIPQDDGVLNPEVRFLDCNDPQQRKEQDEGFWCKWASTKYVGSYQNTRELYWPAPSSMSIWSIDMFRRCWNDCIEHVFGGKIESCEVPSELPSSVDKNNSSSLDPNGSSVHEALAVPRGNSVGDQQSVPLSGKHQSETLAYCWIAAGCAVIDGKQVEQIDKRKPGFERWQALFHKLNSIAYQYRIDAGKGGETESIRCTKNWLENVVVMMMPEMGLPTHLMFQLLFGLNVPEYDRKDLGFQNSIRMSEKERYQHGNRLRAGTYHSELKRAIQEMCKYYLDEKAAVREAEDWFDPGKGGDMQRFYLARNQEVSEEFVKQNRHLLNALADEYGITLEKQQGNVYTVNPSGVMQIQEIMRNQLSWLQEVFPFVKFMTENKTEIRMRRGVRLALLRHIGNGELTARLKRSSCVFLADHDHHSDLKEFSEDFKAEYGNGPLEFADPENHELRECEWKDFVTTGKIFEGGGLVPHWDEIPESMEDRLPQREIKESINHFWESGEEQFRKIGRIFAAEKAVKHRASRPHLRG